MTAHWLESLQRTVVIPLVNIIRGSQMRIVGISGAPGAGKSTLAGLLAAFISDSGKDVLNLSLDDFCYGRLERNRRGIRWRAAPGSHDTNLLEKCLDQLRLGASGVVLPRYDKSIDDRGEDLLLERSPDLVLLDGWFVGSPSREYTTAWAHVGLHVHLDVPLSVAKDRRFTREGELRRAGGGLSVQNMATFWDEVLGPVTASHVAPAGLAADVIVETRVNEGAVAYGLVDRRG